MRHLYLFYAYFFWRSQKNILVLHLLVEFAKDTLEAKLIKEEKSEGSNRHNYIPYWA